MNLLYMGQKIIVHVLFTGTTKLFTQLKIILLQYFQFLIFNFNKNKLYPNECKESRRTMAPNKGKTQELGTSTIADKPSSCFGTKKTKKIVTFDSRKLEASYTFDWTTVFADRNNSRHVDFLWV